MFKKIKLAAFMTMIISSFVFGDDLPYPYLAVSEIHEEGLILALDDGSEWDIKYYSGPWSLLGWGWTEKENVAAWSPQDVISIHLNSINLFDFLLLIQNHRNGEVVWASLRQAPVVGPNSSCLWVDKFDRAVNSVNVTNIAGNKIELYRTSEDQFGAFLVNNEGELQNWETGDPLTLVEYGYGEGYLCWNHRTDEIPFVRPLDTKKVKKKLEREAQKTQIDIF